MPPKSNPRKQEASIYQPNVGLYLAQVKVLRWKFKVIVNAKYDITEVMYQQIQMFKTAMCRAPSIKSSFN